jgi:hypothetical protein
VPHVASGAFGESVDKRGNGMSEPVTLTDALAALDQAQAVHVAALTERDSLAVQLTELTPKLDALQAERDTLSTALGDLQAAHEAAQVELNDLRAQTKSVNDAAIALVATVGIPPVSVVQPTQPEATLSLDEQLTGVTDPLKRGQIRAAYIASFKH